MLHVVRTPAERRSRWPGLIRVGGTVDLCEHSDWVRDVLQDAFDTARAEGAGSNRDGVRVGGDQCGSRSTTLGFAQEEHAGVETDGSRRVAEVVADAAAEVHPTLVG